MRPSGFLIESVRLAYLGLSGEASPERIRGNTEVDARIQAHSLTRRKPMVLEL